MQKKKDLNIRIGANIQAIRESNGYTQERLAEILDITPNHLSAIERGVTGATLEKIVQLCQLFGVSSDYLLFGGSMQDDFAKEVAAQISCVRPEYRPKIQKILAALSEIVIMQEKENH